MMLWYAFTTERKMKLRCFEHDDKRKHLKKSADGGWCSRKGGGGAAAAVELCAVAAGCGNGGFINIINC
jgi:hypothetical protein